MPSRSTFDSKLRAVTLSVLGVCLFISAGCKTEEAPPGPPKLVPAGGKISHEGKPLAGAIVQFNPTGPLGHLLSIGETNEAGEYQLKHMGFPGAAPGEYKVAVSLKLTSKGKPVTIAQNSALSPDPDVIAAKEVIPPQFSSLGQTTMTATVTDQGGRFDFDIKGPLLEPPAAEPAAPPVKDESKPAAEAKMP